MKGSVYFIGEQRKKREWYITRKPSFYDAVLLSYQATQISEDFPYQRIPLCSANIAFNFHDHHISFTSDNQTLQIVTGGQESLSEAALEEEVFHIFNSLLVKQGKTVSYLIKLPKRNHSQVKMKTEKDTGAAIKIKQQPKNPHS
ncbi:hypothetical protein [Bacillus rubiinfantis]|uniref:hypothetical protein n=1 Tax=Bacillus rubiinfantis TaxID=1499680 RepID=UPI0005A89D7E|nr:hypothetical protein [Bacillus rubiinfantis]